MPQSSAAAACSFAKNFHPRNANRPKRDIAGRPFLAGGIFFLVLMFASGLFFQANASSVITLTIGMSQDDACSSTPAPQMNEYTSSSLRVGTFSDDSRTYASGLRFTDVRIPPKSEIQAANLTMTLVNENDSGGQMLVRPKMLLDPDARDFASDPSVIDRSPLEICSLWVIDSGAAAGSRQTSRSLADQIADLTELEDWESGSSVTIILLPYDDIDTPVEFYSFDANNAATLPTLTIQFDPFPPVVESIVLNDENPITGTAVVTCTVTFSQQVTGVDASDFHIQSLSGDCSEVQIASISPNSSALADIYTVALHAGANDKVFRLDLLDDDSIQSEWNVALCGYQYPGSYYPSANGDFSDGDICIIDNGSTGSPPAITDIPSDGLNLWLKGDYGVHIVDSTWQVYKWEDASGNGAHAVQYDLNQAPSGDILKESGYEFFLWCNDEDGYCCDNGSGGYQVIVNGETVISGTAFEDFTNIYFSAPAGGEGCDPSESSVQVVFTTDDNPTDMGWEIYNVETWDFIADGSYEDANTVFTTTLCLEPSQVMHIYSVYFQGDDDLDLHQGLDGITDITVDDTADVFVVMKDFDNGYNYLGYPAFVVGQYPASNPSVFMGASDGNFLSYFMNGPSYPGHGDDAYMAPHQQKIGNAVKNGETALAFLDAIPVDERTYPSPASTGAYSLGYLKYMAEGSIYTSQFNGMVSEVILYSRVLSNEEREQVNQYLAAKYDIELNNAPTDINLSSATVEEGAPNGTVIGTFTTEDPDEGDTFTYELVDDAGGRFALSGDQLVVADELLLDYEAVSQHTITVRTRDLDGVGYTLDKDFVIQVLDAANDRPTGISLSPDTVAENSPAGTLVGTLATQDPNNDAAFTYTLTDDDGGCFYMDDDKIYAADAALLNFETQITHTITLQTQDPGGLTWEQTLEIHVLDLNDQPANLKFNPEVPEINENVNAGKFVTALSTVDEDAGQTFTYSVITDSVGGGAFAVSGQNLVVGDSSYWNYEVNSVITATIRTTDSGSPALHLDRILTVNLVNKNEAPTDILTTILNDPVPEDGGAALVMRLKAVDEDEGQTYTYTKIADSPSGAFSVSAYNQYRGNVIVANASLLDYDTQPECWVRVRCTDSGIPYGVNTKYVEKTFTFHLSDVIDEAPTGIFMTPEGVDENTPNGTLVGQLTAVDTDENDTHIFSLMADDSGGAFRIRNDGRVIVNDSSKLNYEALDGYPRYYTLTVRAIDSMGLEYTGDLQIIINDVNEAPTDIDFTGGDSVNERTGFGEGQGGCIAFLSSTDPDLDKAVNHSIASDPLDGAFKIEGSVLWTDDASKINYEENQTVTLRIRATDEGNPPLYYEEDFVVSVINANDPPTDITISNSSVVEFADAGSLVGSLSTEDEDGLADAHQYLIIDDTSLGGFALVDNILVVGNPNVLIYQGQPTTHTVTIRSVDSGYMEEGWTAEGDFGTPRYQIEKGLVISVTPGVNYAPERLYLNGELTGFTVTENEVVNGQVIGVITVDDYNPAQTHVFEIASDDSGGGYAVIGDQLVISDSAKIDFETAASNVVRIRVTDNGVPPKSYEQDFGILVEDSNDAPDIEFSGANYPIPENVPAGEIVGWFTADDQDVGQSHIMSIASGGENHFVLEQSGNQWRLIVNAALNYEVWPSYDMEIYCVDDGTPPRGVVKAFTIEVEDTNDPPYGLHLSSTEVDEGTPAGTVVATLTTDDPDVNDDYHSYTLLSDSTGGGFQIASDKLLAADASKLVYTPGHAEQITIQTKDLGGLTYERTFVITINDVQFPMESFSLDSKTVTENSEAGTLIGVFTGQDPDHNASTQYTLTDNPGNAFRIVIDELQVNLQPAFDFEASPTLSITVEAQDLSDQGAFSPLTKTFTINLQNANDAPTDISLDNNQAGEDWADGTVIGAFTTEDEDGGLDRHEYALITDPTNGGFAIDGENLVVGDSSLLTYDADNPTRTIRVSSTDSGFMEEGWTEEGDNGTPRYSTVKNLAVWVVPEINTAPYSIALSSNTVPENTLEYEVGTLSVQDDNASQSHTFEIVSDSSGGAFVIEGDRLIARYIGWIDYETAQSHVVRVKATDDGVPAMSCETDITINVEDKNEPADLEFDGDDNIDENAAVPAYLGMLTVLEPDAGQLAALTILPPWDSYFHTEKWGQNEDGDEMFSLFLDQSISSAEHPQINLYITTLDDGAPPISSTHEFLFLMDPGENTPPLYIQIDGSVATTLPEDAPANTVVGTLTAVDANPAQTHTFTLLDDADGRFYLDGDVLKVAEGADLDYETNGGFTIQVRAADNGEPPLHLDQPIIINLEDGADPPTDVNVFTLLNPVREDRPVGTVIARIDITDPDAVNDYTYEIQGAGYDDFSIQESNGVPYLVTAAALDHAVMPSYTLGIIIHDGNYDASAQYTVNVDRVDFPTTSLEFILLDGGSAIDVEECRKYTGNVHVGELSAQDGNGDAILNYELTEDANGRFAVYGHSLWITEGSEFDFEAQQVYVLEAKAWDLYDDEEMYAMANVTVQVGDVISETMTVGKVQFLTDSIQEFDGDGNLLDAPVMTSSPVWMRRTDEAVKYDLKTINTNTKPIVITGTQVLFSGPVTYMNIADLWYGSAYWDGEEYVYDLLSGDLDLFTGPCRLDADQMIFTPVNPDDGPVLCGFSTIVDAIQYKESYILGEYNPPRFSMVFDGTLLADGGDYPMPFTGLGICPDAGIRFITTENASLNFSGLTISGISWSDFTFNPAWERLETPETFYLGNFTDYKALTLDNLEFYADYPPIMDGASFMAGIDVIELEDVSLKDNGIKGNGQGDDFFLKNVLLDWDYGGAAVFDNGYFQTDYWNGIFPAGVTNDKGLYFNSLDIATHDSQKVFHVEDVNYCYPRVARGRTISFTQAASEFSALDWEFGPGYFYSDDVYFESGTDTQHGGDVYSDFTLTTPQMDFSGAMSTVTGNLEPTGEALGIRIYHGSIFPTPSLMRFPDVHVDWNLLDVSFPLHFENLELYKSYDASTGQDELFVRLPAGVLDIAGVEYDQQGSYFTSRGLEIPSPDMHAKSQWNMENGSLLIDNVLIHKDGITWENPTVIISGFDMPITDISPMPDRNGMQITCAPGFNVLGEPLTLDDLEMQFPKPEDEGTILGEDGGLAIPKLKFKGVGVAGIILQIEYDPQAFFKFGGGVVLPFWTPAAGTVEESGQGISGWVAFRDGKFDGVFIKVIGMNIPLGDSGVYMQDIGIGLEGTAGKYQPPNDVHCEEVSEYLVSDGEICWQRSLVFVGEIRFTGGPAQKVGPVSVAMLAGLVEFTTDIGGAIKLEGTIQLMGIADIAGAKVLIVFSGAQQGVMFSAYMPIYQYFTGAGGIYITFDGWVSGYARISLKIPDNIPIAGGFEFAGVGCNFDNEGIGGNASVLGIFSIGFRVDAEGFHAPVKGVTETLEWENPYNQPRYWTQEDRKGDSGDYPAQARFQFGTNLIQLSKHYSLDNAGEGFRKSDKDFTGDAVELELPAGDPVIVRLNYELEGGDPHFTLTSPSGTVFTPEANPFDVDNPVEVMYRQNAAAMEACCFLSNPEGGTYTASITSPASLGQYIVEALTINKAPSIDITDAYSDGQTIYVEWDQIDEDDPVTTTLYLANERDINKHIGSQYAQVPVETAGAHSLNHTYDLIENPVASRYYWIMAKIDDGKNAARFAYSDAPIYVPDLDAPPSIENIRVEVRNESTALVTWDLLEDDAIIGYRIVWTDDLEDPNYKYDQTETEQNLDNSLIGASLVTDLTPGKRYRFSAAAIKEIETSETTRAGKYEIVSEAAQILMGAKALDEDLTYGMEDEDTEFRKEDLGQQVVLAEPNSVEAEQALGRAEGIVRIKEGGRLGLDNDQVKALAEHAVHLAANAEVQRRGFSNRKTKEETDDTVKTRAVESPFENSVTVLMINHDAVNNVPVITSTPKRDVVQAGSTFTYQVQAYDPDGDALSYLVSDDGGAAGIEISDAGLVSWTPTEEQTGTWTVTIAIQDDQLAESSQTFYIYVAGMPPEASASIISDPQVFVSAGALFSYQLVVESDNKQTALEFSLLKAPTGMTIDANTGLVTWQTSAPGDIGTYEISVMAKQGDLEDVQTFTLQVQNIPPVITGQAKALTTPEETPLEITFSDILVQDDQTYPDDFQMQIGSGDNYSYADTTITPNTDFNGVLSVPVQVYDGLDESGWFNLVVTVTAVNDIPLIIGQEDISIAAGQAREITLNDLTVEDPDNAYPADFTLQVLPGDHYTVNGTAVTKDADYSGPLTIGVRVNDTQADSPVYELYAPDSEDLDADYMNDAWEGQYGLDSSIDDSAGDLDSDGVDNLTEYNCQTAPNDPASRPYAPMAWAYCQATADPGAKVVLDGMGSSDFNGDALTCQWTQLSGESVEINDAQSPRAWFTAPPQAGGALEFALTVRDYCQESTRTCIVNVTAADDPPTANAGADQTVSADATVTLDGSASADARKAIATYEWEQVGGPEVVLAGEDTATPAFTAPTVLEAGAALEFRLTVANEQGFKAQDFCIVNVTGANDPPTANAGAGLNVAEGANVILNGSASSDPEGDVLYFWRQVSGPSVCLSDPTAQTPAFVAPSVAAPGGAVEMELIVMDDQGLMASGGLTIQIADNGLKGFDENVTPFESFDGEALGICALEGGVTYLDAIDPETIADETNRPDQLMCGLIDVEMRAYQAGDRVSFTVTLPEPASAACRWYKYSAALGWYDFSRDLISGGAGDGAEFSHDRTQVTVYITDNGPYDDDPTQALVRDPSGAGSKIAASRDKGKVAADFGKEDGGCFIQTLMR
ncbi:Cadherin domain-containing protein [Desulfatibacillum alkenivorans DSM 16219]|jgi:hypothetical protein|uniref:Cadherin domain-containing protein n=1 Tax=Desulfatibacillum alkenivorans DSM 16219 TaxID=1121393 RepID=A0A1M6UYC6_9BACT|nr:cadherin domain-containing protein [Desulfatibacillum alkenivorans]SHK74154.1 Cadherin domain-containing protein [Desulfatibacillum alkenivorans DSM 16219]